MFSRTEKLKKNFPSPSEQLDLVKAISAGEKRHLKRLWIIIAIILTVGLSMGFSFYRRIRLSPFRLGLPSIEIPLPPANLDLGPITDSIISSDQNIWSFYVEVKKPDHPNLTWTKNQPQLFSSVSFNDTMNKFDRSPPPSPSIAAVLPKGLDIKQIEVSNNQLSDIRLRLNLPQKRLLIFVKVSGSDLSVSRQLIPPLVNKIYWQLVNY